MGTNFNERDALLIKSDALPNNASTTVGGTAIDLGSALTGLGARIQECELLLSAPAVNATMAPDTKTFTYTIETCSATAFSTGVTAIGTLVQTGASSAGAAAATLRVRLPSDCPRYVRAKCVSGALTADASTVKMKLELLV